MQTQHTMHAGAGRTYRVMLTVYFVVCVGHSLSLDQILFSAYINSDMYN